MESQEQKSKTLVNKILSLKHRDGQHTEFLPLIYKWDHQKCPLKINVMIINIKGDVKIDRSWDVKQMYDDGFTADKKSLNVVPLEYDEQLEEGWVILHNSWDSTKDPSRLTNPKATTTGSMIKFAGR